MSKYQSYKEYKDSGVEWLGAIPSHWQMKRVKETAQIVNGYPFDSSKFDPSIGKPLVRIRDINSKITQVFYNGYVPEEAIINNFDILVGMDGDFNVCEWKGGEAALNQRVCCIRSMDKYLQKYFYYLLPDKIRIINDLTYFTTVKHLSSNDLLKIVYAIPSKNEYVRIVNFLDHETAKIDTLIENQKKLIALLKEKRQAVISHAVTKGLNPDVPMKDSGVEWLGKVPEGWEVRQLRFIGTCQNGINIGGEYFGSGSPFISYGDVYKNASLPESFEGLVQSTDNDRKIYAVNRGDVLFTRTSETIEEIGFSSTCLNDIKDATFAGFLIRFRPLLDILHPEFSKFFFRNELLRAFFVKEMNLVTRASLSQELLKKLPVTLPSIQEQIEIANSLNQKELVFDRLILNSQNQTKLLKERRTALISAAVTGKIDVRNWQA